MTRKRKNDRLWKVWLLYCNRFLSLIWCSSCGHWINTSIIVPYPTYKRNGVEFMEFAGLQNFEISFGMAAGERGYVLSYLKNTPCNVGLQLYSQILVSFFGCMADLDEKVKVKGTGAMKVIVYLPSVITAASVSAVLFKFCFPSTDNHPDFEGSKCFGKNFDFLCPA